MLNNKRHGALLLVGLLLASTLTGCSGQDEPAVTATSLPTQTAIADEEINISASIGDPDAHDIAAASNAAATAEPLPTLSLTEKQKNSINMLNHIVVFSQEVNASKNSRLFLEEAYTSLYNNTNPNAIDSRTQVEINYLFELINEYRMTAVKRERLEYVYEQNRAQAIRDAIPNPLSLLSAVRSRSLAGLLTSVVYMAVDSASSYQTGTAQADLKYLQDGWALDDEQAKTMHAMRSGTFNYMVDTVREFDLPGYLALNEKSVANFVEWKEYSNVQQKIQLFEDSRDTYAAFGPYWLTMAECYYENGDYDKCLSAIGEYEALETRIFRNDYDYARALPLAIAAAEQVLTGNEYENKVKHYVKAICDNTDNEEWALKYFAAQTYVDLFSRTNKPEYLAEAYKIARGNVSFLLIKQSALNAEYMADVKPEPVPQGATEQQRKDIDQYNALKNEERKTALPPIYEPLYLNCELLFALGDVMGISEDEIDHINGILHENSSPLFLARALDQVMWFGAEANIDASQIDAQFLGGEIVLPAAWMTDKSSIKVTVENGENVAEITDWRLNRVDRHNKEDIDTFKAHYSSQAAASTHFTAGSRVTVEVDTMPGSDAQKLVFAYDVVSTRNWLGFEMISFARVIE